MKIIVNPVCFVCFLLLLGCAVPEQKTKTVTTDNAAGRVEIYDSSALNGIRNNAPVEIIGRNYKWSEGPVWIPAKQMLLFSAVRENIVYEWNGKDTPVAWLTPSGYTDTAVRNGENGSNGLALDKDGKLLLCQSGNRQVVRMDAALDSPLPKFIVLANNYQGKKFNSPNDLVADSRNNIYFTDPIYGLPQGEKDPTRELPFEGVYKISSSGKLSLLIDSIPHPNGIALSPDEKILYVGSSDQHTKWYAYHLDEKGDIQSGGIFLDGDPLTEKANVKTGADGFKTDNSGNIYSSGPDGINIISPTGKLLGLIRIYNKRTSNCCFNETKDVLFITSDDRVLKVNLK
jgi:gluconolactonase